MYTWGECLQFTANLPTRFVPAKIARLKTPGEFPADMRIPALEIKILTESNPLTSRISVRRLAARLAASLLCKREQDS